MARILVTGAGGLVGSRMAVRLRAAHEVHGTYHDKPLPPLGLPPDRVRRVDITKEAELGQALEAVDPDVVVHCAAMTDVDGCEGKPDEARRANVFPVEQLAGWARRRGARVVLMSTDFVFDGTSPPYEVDAKPNPLCVYSTTKAEAEAAIARAPGAVILRSAVIYGADYGHGKPNFAVWLMGELKAGRPVRVVSDQKNNPTVAELAAEFAARAIERRAEGVFHAAGRDCVARDEFARRIAQRFDLDPSLIVPVKTAELKQRAKRPARACLSLERSEKELDMKAWTLAESLNVLHRLLGLGPVRGPQPWW